MKRLRLYWRNQPDDLKVMDVVDHIRFGLDDEQCIATDAAIPTIRALTREFPEHFWTEDVEDVSPHDAAELVCRVAPSAAQVLLPRLIQLVGTESAEAAERLRNQYRERLGHG
ncbi:MAG: hypothetical protein FJ315_02860 [SAR202 cluster bacterium]|nr:hypothetical protein [SAR202 cluster bacterium]